MADFKQVIEESFGQYAGAVIQSRAIIDVRDCLKPSARQVFFCMNKDKFTADHPFQKTLKAVGSAFQVYIHGDASCEGIIMRAGQPFSLRYPLVEVEGSYGNAMESGNWAAPRYTGARLSKISKALFEDIQKDTIAEWRDNYDDTLQYPAVLPSKGFYNIVNGTQGIGVGLASSIPQFNLAEVNSALAKLLLNPEATFEELYCAPDFATGGIVINEDAIKESLRKGNGKACTIRAKFDYDKKKNVLTVIEIPFNVYTNTICKELEAIVNGAENPGIERFNDLTGLNPCIKIYLEKSANVDYIINFLYKNTSLQSSYGINMTMLENGRYPKVYGWKEALQAHLDHEVEVYTNAFNYDLKKIAHKIKIDEAIVKAILNIERVIEIIKASTSIKEANEQLQSFLEIDEEQAKAILDIKLARLAKLEVEKYQTELAELCIEHERIEKILNSKDLLNKEIIAGFEKISKTFGDARRTEVMTLHIPKEEKEAVYVEPQKVIVVLTESGLVKRVPTSSFRTQRKNGKGIKTQDDITSTVLRTNDQDQLLIFSNAGTMYRLPVIDVPEGTNTTKGTSVRSLVPMEPNEKPAVIYSIYKDTPAKYVLFTTKNGLVKKTSLDEYTKTKKRNGLAAIGLKEGDELASVNLILDEQILLITANGMAIRCNSTDIPAAGRTTTGVKGINLAEGDCVVSTQIIRHDTDNLAVFVESGLGKQVPLAEFPSQGRGGKGLVCYKPTDATGKVVAAALLEKSDSLLISGNKSSICLLAEDIPTVGRASIGSQLIKDNKILNVSKV